MKISEGERIAILARLLNTAQEIDPHCECDRPFCVLGRKLVKLLREAAKALDGFPLRSSADTPLRLYQDTAAQLALNRTETDRLYKEQAEAIRPPSDATVP